MAVELENMCFLGYNTPILNQKSDRSGAGNTLRSDTRKGSFLMCIDHTTPLKTCSKCGETKPATTEHFNRCQRSPGGLRAKCKECRKLETQERYTINPDYNRAYYLANQERLQERARSYGAAHREQERARVRLWREKHPERARASKRAAVLRRLARKRGAQGNHTAKDVQLQYEAQKGKCYYCKATVGDTYHVDHVIPLSRGGSNGPENIVIACQVCNQSKGGKLPHEWPEGGRLL